MLLNLTAIVIEQVTVLLVLDEKKDSKTWIWTNKNFHDKTNMDCIAPDDSIEHLIKPPIAES